MNKNFEILGKLAESGIEVTMLSVNSFAVGGFYKSGTVTVDLVAETITARYNEVSAFNGDLRQILVDTNYDWWQHSKDRFDGWASPDSNWLPLLMEYGLITKVEKTVVEYK